MTWTLRYLPEISDDLNKLDGSQRIVVRKSIQKVLQNPLPTNEGGYGKPLGSRNDTNLTGCYKIKLKNAGLRVVYKLIRTNDTMLVIVIGARADSAVYKMAKLRIEKYDL